MAGLARLTTPSSPKIINPIGDESNVAWKRLTLRWKLDPRLRQFRDVDDLDHRALISARPFDRADLGQAVADLVVGPSVLERRCVRTVALRRCEGDEQVHRDALFGEREPIGRDDLGDGPPDECRERLVGREERAVGADDEAADRRTFERREESTVAGLL